MKSKILGLLAVGLLSEPMSAHAALISSSPLNGVAIGGSTYNVTFWQDESGQGTTAAQANALPVTFSSLIDAETARDAVYNALLAYPAFDFTPADASPVFYVLYSVSVSGGRPFAYCNLQYSTCSNTGGGWSGAGGAFATFEGSTAVPEPGTLALFGLGLLGLGVTRRRKLN